MTATASLALRRAEHGRENGRQVAKAGHGDIALEARISGEDLWISFARGSEQGGLAWRVPLFIDDVEVLRAERPGLMALDAVSPLGRHRVDISAEEGEEAMFSLTVSFRPQRQIHLPFLPRDLVAIGPDARPDRPKGRIEASQRRLNTGLCYFSLEEPDFGKVLYVQDLTALNPYFRATGTKPESAVGGQWPEVGYLAPTQPGDPSKALPGGRDTLLSRAWLLVRRFPQHEEGESAWQFLDMLAAAYRRMEKAGWEHRDWVGRSRRTLRDLSGAAKLRTRHRGHTYFHPYTEAEYPDSMVQLSLLSAIHAWGRWSGRRHRLEREIAGGLRGFFDAELGTLRRYLPDVGDDKDPDAVDSWYLYHPLAMLAQLALSGEDYARELFFASIDYGIKAARHFNYRWPIQYKIDSFEVITAVAADDRGQTDVGGMYAWVMLQAFTLSGETRFLEEARAAIDASEGMRFNLNYQANLTAWGATACIKLWRITGQKRYLTQSYVYLASFFHNSQIWESEIGHAAHYSNFLGATCLQDAPYMAMYECFDSYAAFEHYLDLGGPDLEPAVKLLVGEYCRYALSRAWFYYPDALPAEALAKDDIRNGHIDRKLNIPVEDLYPDGQPAGQVGQEVYGAGGAMVFATRAFHRTEGAPFLLHCDHFLRALVRTDERALAFALDGHAGAQARVSLVREKGRRAGFIARLYGPDAEIEAQKELEGEGVLCRFTVPAQGSYTLRWGES